jgi:hypothetical protein
MTFRFPLKRPGPAPERARKRAWAVAARSIAFAVRDAIRVRVLPIPVLFLDAAFSIFLATALLTGSAAAQELDPRTFSPTPVGTTVTFVSGGSSEGGFVLDPSLGIEDVAADLSFSSAGFAHVFELAGRQARVLAVAPYAWGDVSGEVGGTSQRQELRGPTDPRFKLTLGLLGAPALSLDELRTAPRRTSLHFDLTVAPPLGDYDSSQLVNLGTNRWAFKPELGVNRPIGRFTLEGLVGAWFFTANHDYFPGTSVQRRDPLLALRGHIAYTVTRRVWLSLDGTWFTGGRTEVDGVASPDRQDNVRLGGTVSVPVGARQSLKLSYNSGATTRRGSDYDTFTLTWQFVRLGGARPTENRP